MKTRVSYCVAVIPPSEFWGHDRYSGRPVACHVPAS